MPAPRAATATTCKEAAILTCATIKKTPGVDLGNGISMDQVAAQKARRQTPLPSLELGIAPVAVGVDLAVGYTRIYGSHIAWSNANTPLAREMNPRGVYERLFRAGHGAERRCGEDWTRCCSTACWATPSGCAPRSAPPMALRLDEYLSVMRSLEQRVQRASERRKERLEAPRVQLKTRSCSDRISPAATRSTAG